MLFFARVALAAASLLIAQTQDAHGQRERVGRTYIVDCSTSAAGTLHSLEEVNALALGAQDSVLFKRGTLCRGSLHPQGSGFRIDAEGTGPLPRIDAGTTDEAALRLFNQENISISSLEIRGGITYGVYISGDKGTMHSISLRNLTVINVRGPLKHKESGLVVMKPASPDATFDGVHLDGIRASNTTQWSGIFIAGGSRDHPAHDVTVTHSVVHDVEGDGIVIFNATDSAIRRSVAWHTGMQHQQTIGTPNAIWTWQCRRCVVEENEAFLTDSPGVDGGAFDIDWGNTLNTVQHNFGHDTQGYCVSVFAANGPTRQSVVSENLCLNNGLSPRLAQRQGAILLMTWNGGVIDGLDVMGNRIDWRPDGDTPVIRAGSGVQAKNVRIEHNEIHTRGTQFIDPLLTYAAMGNRYFLQNAVAEDLLVARESLAHETNADVAMETEVSSLRAAAVRISGWRLVATVPAHAFDVSPDLAAVFINLKTTALEYTHGGLAVWLFGDAELLQSARDWGLADDGVQVRPSHAGTHGRFSLKLISPAGKIVREWKDAASPIELGLALQRFIGSPVYGRLSLEQVRATD